MGVIFYYIITLQALGKAREVNVKCQQTRGHQMGFLGANVNTVINDDGFGVVFLMLMNIGQGRTGQTFTLLVTVIVTLNHPKPHTKEKKK